MLNRLALRLCTVRALRGRTIVRDNVRDSEIGPIDEVADAQPRPVIVVYTDDAMYHAGDRDLFATQGDDRVESGWLHLVIEIAVTQKMTIRGEDGQVSEDVIQPRTDASLELTVDIIERQVRAALTDPRSVWGEMWRRFALYLGSIETKRGTMARDGSRFAGRQLQIQVKIPKDPPPGTPIGPLWTDFLALCADDPDLAQLVPMLNSLIAGYSPALDEYEAVLAGYGLTAAEGAATLLKPVGT